MRRRSLAVVLLAASLVAALGLQAPAAAVDPVHVTAVTADPGPFAVDGVSTNAAIPISLVATDDRGAIGQCIAGDGEWGSRVAVTLERTAGGPPATTSLDLRTHSTSTDGEHWTGVWRAGSNRGGTWTITALRWCVGATFVEVDPRAVGITASTVLTATHVPTVTYRYAPAVAKYGARQWVTATYTDGYGQPLRSYPIVYGDDNMCGVDFDGNRQLSTDTHGQVTVRIAHGLLQCLYFAYPGRLPWSPTTVMFAQYWVAGPMYYRSVSAALSTSVVRVGRAVTVKGTVSPNWQAPVALQRLVGRTWRTVATAHVRASGHVTFTYVPTSRGTTYLRIRALPYLVLVATTSRPMTLTAVRR